MKKISYSCSEKNNFFKRKKLSSIHPEEKLTFSKRKKPSTSLPLYPIFPMQNRVNKRKIKRLCCKFPHYVNNAWMIS